MNRGPVLLPLLVYLTLDLTNPFVAGAFQFNPDECVEVYHHRASPAERTDALALFARRPVMRFVLPPPSPVRPPAGGRHVVFEWLAEVREDVHGASDPPLSDDH